MERSGSMTNAVADCFGVTFSPTMDRLITPQETCEMTGADRETFCIEEFTVAAVVFGVGMHVTPTAIPANTLFTREGSFSR